MEGTTTSTSVLASCSESVVKLWSQSKLLVSGKDESDESSTIAFSPHGTQTTINQLCWNHNSNHSPLFLVNYSPFVCSFDSLDEHPPQPTTSTTDKVIGSVGDDGLVYLFQPNGNVIQTLSPPASSVTSSTKKELTSIAFSSNSKHICTAGADAVIRLWDLKKAEIVRLFKVDIHH